MIGGFGSPYVNSALGGVRRETLGAAKVVVASRPLRATSERSCVFNFMVKKKVTG
jgi:hypothetical protein